MTAIKAPAAQQEQYYAHLGAVISKQETLDMLQLEGEKEVGEKEVSGFAYLLITVGW